MPLIGPPVPVGNHTPMYTLEALSRLSAFKKEHVKWGGESSG